MEQSKAGHSETGSAVPTVLSVLVDRLKEEHIELKKSISELAARAKAVKSEQDLSTTRHELFQLRLHAMFFREKLEQHSAWEEEILFPFLSSYFDQSIKPSLLGSMWTLEKDHELGDDYLQSFLRTADEIKTVSDRKRMHDAADELIQACCILGKHLESEEQIVFPLTESVLVDMELLFCT
ncbi:hemerythrin domain-containing protein [Paenibacillus sp. PAMC21692]|uniref:hemerythrin domain-containing protein n=1 Tax=Paenibacillus sp. PAMC21692 TaxID=2762320 RepID=UPI00164DFB83|nr:hemerythrin domain-containing protein [Paenibacillus sp. PAMC21692]QNK58704.1 hemerythrin domain-containing protein [Paenibacillus sp. PAMC21692]